MKNNAIKEMFIRQFGWDHRDVEVEFLYYNHNGYTFHVTHNPGYKAGFEKYEIIVKSEQIYNSIEDTK